MAATGSTSSRHPPFDGAKRQVFVIGNDAADVDSLVSAYAMASLLESAEVQAIALAQITREEFRLRGDGLLLFRQAGSQVAADGSPCDMRFWDEVDWDAVRGLDKRSLVLTDHNKMAGKVCEIFDGRVEWILDHHSDTGSYPEARRDLDESVGSACTLVAEHFLAKSLTLPREVGLLLAGVILLDCRNFGASGEGSRGVRRDRAALDRLKPHVPEVGESAWYEELKTSRYDVSHLSVRELLMLDLKAAPVAGFPGPVVAFAAMMATLDECCAKEGGPAALLETIRRFAVERGYEAVVCNFATDANGLKGLALAPVSDAQQALCSAVESRVAGAPGNLPKALLENPLYASQGILEQGFGLVPRPDLEPLRAFGMRAEISRKTLLPRATSEDGSSSL